jgi:subtilisin
MTASSTDARRKTKRRAGAKRGAARQTAARNPRGAAALERYLIAPTERHLGATTLTQRLRDLGINEIVRALEPQGSGLPPVAIVRITAETAAALRRTPTGPRAGALLVERDHALQPQEARAAIATAVPLGPGFTTTIQVQGQAQGQNEQPVEGALVQVVGRQWTAQGLTGRDGKVRLTLFGELPGRAVTVLVKPRAGYWGLCRRTAELQDSGVTIITLRALTITRDVPWGGRAMRFDQLPAEYRGAGSKIALIDTGVAVSHRQLAAINRGFDASNGDARSWSQDPAGHGTACAGILVAAADNETGVRGYAPDAELQVCKLGLDAHLGDLVSALDDCIEQMVDIVCIGFGADHGSAIVEQRIAAAKQRGIAIIAAAGSDGGAVQFPACSPFVLAVGAIGQAGVFPDTSLHALQADTPQSDLPLAAGSGLFVPPFSCAGPEIDLCAPGVAVISCASPDGYAAYDGTSLAAPHVAALAALVLAHNAELRFSRRGAARVERLFQLLKASALPLGAPERTGAGLPDAPRALGIQAPMFAPWPKEVEVAGRLSELRRAMRLAGLAEGEGATEAARGPAIVSQVPLSRPSIMPTDGRGTGPAPGVQPDLRTLQDAMLRAGLGAGAWATAGPR